ncbi:MAG: glycosyltransferase family 2 protein [Bacteroidota bacterium]
MNNLVSIILPNYNHATYLRERLESILNQSYQNFELIILDDASNDGSLSILKECRNHARVSHFILNKENSGSPFKQWAKGLEFAKGRIIWIAESDDYCRKDFLETQIKQLTKPDVMVSVCKTVVVDQDGQPVKEAKHHLFQDSRLCKKICSEDILKIPILNVSSICFKREVLSSTSFFSEFNIIGDRVFYQEFFLNQIVCMNENSISYFRRLENAVSNFNNLPMRRKKLYFLENLKFIKREYKLKNVNKKQFNSYLEKFFNKIRNRTSRKEKLSLAYLLLFFKYKYELKS